MANEYGYKDGPFARQQYAAIMNKYKKESGPTTAGGSIPTVTPQKRKAGTAKQGRKDKATKPSEEGVEEDGEADDEDESGKKEGFR